MVGIRQAFVLAPHRAEAFPARGRPARDEQIIDTASEEYSPKISPDGGASLQARTGNHGGRSGFGTSK
jgi:hypothetical protein